MTRRVGWVRLFALTLIGVIVAAAAVVPLAATARALVWPHAAPHAAQSPAGRGVAAPITPSPGTFLGTWELLGSSLLWAAIPALIASLIAWPMAVAIAARLRRGRGGALFALATVPALVPGYLVFWSLWVCVGPGSVLGTPALRAGLAGEVRLATLVVSLVTWSVPFALVPVVARRLAAPDPSHALRLIDGAGMRRRVAAAFRADRGALLRGAACAAIAILAENVAFDLAQVRTYGYELRTLDATGASVATISRLGWPGVAAALALLAIATSAWQRGGARRSAIPVERLRPGRTMFLGATCALLVLPLALVVGRSMAAQSPREFAILYGGAALTSAALACAAGAIGAAIAVVLALSWRDGSRGVRLAARAIAATLILAFAAPATLIAVGLEQAYNTAWTAWIYDGPAIVVLALVARAGVVAAVVAPFAAALEPQRTRDLLALDAPRAARSIWRARRPVALTACAVAGLATTALAFGEIAVTARVRPPMMDLLATATLNAIHYQQPETVVFAATACVLLALVGAVTLATVVARRARPLALAVIALGLAACARATDDDGVPALPVAAVRGSPGFGPGQFHTPRVVAVDPTSGRFYVIDKESRVQRFAPDGTYELEWQLPEHAMGCPVGASVHPDGRVFVSDTHYHRVIVYDPEGNELARFGSFGFGPGEFIYVTDVAFHPDGRIYVGEYGSNDRIQVFDAAFRPIGSFGSMGSEVGQFGRPQSLVFDAQRDELYVADSNNHRIVVCDADGTVLRTLGGVGSGPGQLAYPRGLALVGDGTLLVSEFGNHRIQHLDARPGNGLGACLGIWGGAGSDLGRLQYPWDLDGCPEHLVALDTGRDRFVMTTLQLRRPDRTDVQRDVQR